MPISQRRVYRLASTVALSLVIAYAAGLTLPYLAPVMAVVLAAKPAKPISLQQLVKLVLVLTLILTTGILVSPLLQHYAWLGFAVVALGLFLANTLSLRFGQEALGTLLTVGLALISAAALYSQALAKLVVFSVVAGVIIAVVSHHLCHWLFPESEAAPAPQRLTIEDATWKAARATLIILPAYFLALVNPSAFLPLILKSGQLGQADSQAALRQAQMDLLLSTALAGVLAIGLWFGLKLAPVLWFFGLWILLFMLFCSARFYGVRRGRFGAEFWMNAMVTTIILIGPAVADSANGKDVYQAFAIRFLLFLTVTLYAGAAVHVLEHLRKRWVKSDAQPGVLPC